MAKDNLERYRQKRDFSQTPEPSGKREKKTGHGYLIQKHAASHLHYDFRLELDGTLKSWAVPKGPSYDPADKRLAMQVEDHPVSYGTFEGTIPKGQYGGGTVMLWDEGTWEPIGDPKAGLAKGKLVFQLHGKRLKGEWTLVRTFSRDKEGNKWLLIKHKDDRVQIGDNTKFLEKNSTSVVSGRTMDEIANTESKVWKSNRVETKYDPKTTQPLPTRKKRGSQKKSPMPGFTPPQLATLSSAMPKGSEWVHEIKFDGYRMIAHIDDHDVRMFSRNGKDWSGKFGSIDGFLAEFAIENAILDGEVIVSDANGKSDFSALKDALSEGDTSKMQYYVFDIIFLNGQSLLHLPLLERKKQLLSLIENNKTKAISKHVIYSKHFENQTDHFLQSVCDLHFEGIMSKRADAPYMAGRSKTWLKTKCHMRQEFVVGGFTLSSAGGQGIGSLLLGYYDNGKFIYAGRVGTGFTSDVSIKLRKSLEKLRQKQMPYGSVPAEGKRGAIWVEPKLIGEVEFTEWTPDGHLRHPSFQGLREDKTAKTIVREIAVSPKSIEREVEEEVEDAMVERKNSKPPKKAGKAQVLSAPTHSLSSKSDKNAADVGGIKISHPSRIIYPNNGVTKLQLAEYYAAVADHMMPHIRDRPISMLRCPEGIGKECFFQRHVGLGKSSFIEEVEVTVKHETRKYIKIADKKGLLSLIQWGVIEIHPWECAVKNLDSPNQMIFDLDPDPAVTWKQLVEGAQEVRARLKQIGLDAFLKTTGGKGLHLVVPIAAIYDWKTIKAFTRAVATSLTIDRPDRYVATMSKTARKGKIFVDYLRNDITSTAVAPFSARAREGATVSTPIAWDELTTSLKLSSFTIDTVPERLRRQKKDPWKGFGQARQKIPAQFLKALKVDKD